MNRFTNQQKFMAVILAIYIPSHLLAFYVYYNPPNDPWKWVDKIIAFLPQMGHFYAFRAPYFQIGSRIAFFLAITYIPMLIVGVLISIYGSKYWQKRRVPVMPTVKLLLMIFLSASLFAIHYAMYWVSVGYGRKLDAMHPLLFSWPPILCGFIIGAIALGTYQIFNGENK